MDKLIELAITSGPAVLLVAAGIFWGKNFIEYFFSESIELKKTELNKALESHKIKLERETSLFRHELSSKLEEHKNKLELIKQEFNIQFSYLHQERANTIKDLYQKLVELQSAMFYFTRTMHPVIEDGEKEHQERSERINRALMDFQNFYAPNKLFLPSATCTKIDDILKIYWDKGWDFAKFQRLLKSGGLTRELYGEFLDQLDEISKSIKNDMPIALSELESMFRQLLLGDKMVSEN